MSNVSVGVCIFDDPRSPQGGFSSIDGAKPTYVSGYHELSPQTLWVTNLEFPVFKELNLLRIRHLAQAQYFRTSIKMLQTECGISDGRDLSQYLSKMFSRVARLGHEYFGANAQDYNYRFHQALSDRIHIPGTTEPVVGIDPNVAQLIVDHCTQENQAMSGIKRPDKSIPVSFLFPRDAFAQWLLARQYPIGNAWKNDGFSKELTLGTRDGLKLARTDSFIKRCGDYIRNNNRAMFFRINVVSHEISHRAFATFGVGSREPRTWATWPELLEMLSYSVVTICESYSTQAGSIRDYIPSFCFEDGQGLSEGLLLENLYVSIGSPINRKNTALGAYMRAYDRAACARAASKFHNAGFVVGSYSSGRVVALISRAQIERASELALNLGMLPPLVGAENA